MGCPPMKRQELRNRDGDLFTNVAKVNNVYLLRAALAACTTDGGDAEPTHDELFERLDKLATWHRRLGHPSFKTVGALHGLQ